MQFFVIALVLGIAVLANGEELWMKDKPVIENCMKEVGADAMSMHLAVKSEMKAVNDKVKCVMACYAKAKGYMNSDGTVDVDKSIQDIPETTKHKKEDIINAVKECASTKADNDCNTTYSVMMCVKEKLK